MNTDDRLKALYRAAAARRAPADVDAATLEQVLQRSGWPDEDHTPLDRIAASPAHADILRAVMALGPDAEALSRDVAALRRPQVVPLRRPGALRSAMALAAGVGAAALLIAGLGQLPTADAPLAPAGSEAILSASFESPETPVEHPAAPEGIFGGGFDS